MAVLAENLTQTIASPPTKPIPRISCPTPEDFERIYVERREPAIFTDIASTWPAYGKWSPEYFQATYGEITTRVMVDMPTEGVTYDLPSTDHQREMSLRDFIDFMKQAEKPCYFRRQPASKLPGVLDDCELGRLTPSEKSPTDYVWIGSADTRTGLHFDMQDVALCQLYGSKAIWLVLPQDSKYIYSYPDSVTKSQVAPDAPDLKKFPKFANATVLHGILGPGEILFIPNRCWHSVISTSPSISVSHEFGRKITVAQILQAVQAGGIRQWLAVAKDFVRYGLLGGHFVRRLADDPPFGRLLYEMLSYAVATRIAKLRRLLG